MRFLSEFQNDEAGRFVFEGYEGKNTRYLSISLFLYYVIHHNRSLVDLDLIIYQFNYCIVIFKNSSNIRNLRFLCVQEVKLLECIKKVIARLRFGLALALN